MTLSPMAVAALLPALLAVGFWCWRPDPKAAADRLQDLLGAPRVTAPGRRPVPLPAVAAVGGLGVALLVGGPVGLLVGAVGAVAVLRVVPRLESRSARHRRVRLATQAPDVLDLLAACLASGASTADAVSAVADAVDDPAAGVLHQVGAQLRLGADPAGAWAGAAAEPALAPLAAAVILALDSGTALSESLPLVADDLRARRRSEVEAAARQVGVQLTAPLGLAFLPAFVLLGVVPVVASLITGVLTLP